MTLQMAHASYKCDTGASTNTFGLIRVVIVHLYHGLHATSDGSSYASRVIEFLQVMEIESTRSSTSCQIVCTSPLTPITPHTNTLGERLPWAVQRVGPGNPPPPPLSLLEMEQAISEPVKSEMGMIQEK